MIGTSILYILMAVLGSLFIKNAATHRTAHRSNLTLSILVPLIVLSILIGGRYNVGTDWENYVDYYKDYLSLGLQQVKSYDFGNSLEPLYVALNLICASVQIPISGFFAIIALLIFIFTLSGHSKEKYLYPFILFFFFGQMFGLSMNIIRQSIAISLFFFSLRFFEEKWKMFLILIAASLFHFSSIVLLLALFIDKKLFSLLDKKYLVLAVFVTSYFVGSYLLPLVDQYLPIQLLSAKYARNANSLDAEMELGSGLGIITRKLVDVFLIYRSTVLIKYYDNSKVNNIYRLYYVGLILGNIMGFSVFLSRVFLGFELLRIFILSYYCYYVFHYKRKEVILASGIIAWNVLCLLMAVLNGSSGCSPYEFNWQ